MENAMRGMLNGPVAQNAPVQGAGVIADRCGKRPFAIVALAIATEPPAVAVGAIHDFAYRLQVLPGGGTCPDGLNGPLLSVGEFLNCGQRPFVQEREHRFVLRLAVPVGR